MYGIFTYIWAMFRVNVGKYSIHGASGIDISIVLLDVNGVYRPTQKTGELGVST